MINMIPHKREKSKFFLDISQTKEKLMKIHRDFTGGNIRFVRQEGDTVWLENEIRDTTRDWFYWAFCAEGAAGQTLTFRFAQGKRVGYWGPAVSHDLEEWRWLDQRDGEGFTYRFAPDEDRVYFAHHLLYHPDRFFRFARENGYQVRTLCQSKKGREIPCLRFGSGETVMLLTARHHACESTGNYVLEGVLSSLAERPIPGVRVLCVPFVDFDGVVDGDQGKDRAPHDPNRDYDTFPALYPAVEEIRREADRAKILYGFDFHAPGHNGGEHDHIYIVRNSVSRIGRFDRFSALLEQNLTPDAMKYSPADDCQPNTRWNKPSPNFGYTMTHRYPGCRLAFSLESTYAGTPDNKTSAPRLIALGRCFAEAVRIYMKEADPGSAQDGT